MSEPTWSMAQVCYATGVTYRTADHWIRCGYFDLKPAAFGEGSGHPRRFTFHDALQIAVMADLTGAGIHPHNVDVKRVMAEDSYTGPFRRGHTTNVQVNVAAIAKALREDLPKES